MNLAVFYHCKISGEGIPSEDYATNVMVMQLQALGLSGLNDAASEIHIGINGSDGDALMVGCFASSKAVLHPHGREARTEIPTQKVIESWLPSHPDWYVLYHHTKGVTHPGQPAYDNWRNRMGHACVSNWRRCVADLDAGAEAVGCHWLTPEKFPGMVTSPFFGGTFWWARAAYLLQLPKLPEATWENRYEAESWIGRRRPYPRVVDYLPGWP